MPETTQMEAVLTHAATECDQVAKAIESVGVAAQKLLSGGLARRTLCILIKDALPRGSRDLTIGEIDSILVAAARLGGRHLERKA